MASERKTDQVSKSPSRYKVLFLTRSYPGRGHPFKGIFIARHAKAVARLHDVVVLHVISDPELRGQAFEVVETEEDGLRVVRVFYRKDDLRNRITAQPAKLFRYLWGSRLGLQRIWRTFGRPDFVHVNIALPAGLLAWLLKKRRGIPYVITEHHSDYTKEDGSYDASPWYYKWSTQLVFRNADAVSAVSNYLLAALRKQKLVRKPAFVVPNVIEIPEEPAHARKPASPINILTISLLNDGPKNVAGLIKAIGKIVVGRSDVLLHIVGDGEDKQRLEDSAQEMGLLGSHIFFHGFVPNEQLEEYFAKAHFYVSNSNFETFSVATAEAIAHGIPVVITNCGGPEEYVSKKVGIVVQKQNETRLIEGIRYMIEHWQEYNPAELQAYAKERFNEAHVGEMFNGIYAKVLGRKLGL